MWVFSGVGFLGGCTQKNRHECADEDMLWQTVQFLVRVGLPVWLDDSPASTSISFIILCGYATSEFNAQNRGEAKNPVSLIPKTDEMQKLRGMIPRRCHKIYPMICLRTIAAQRLRRPKMIIRDVLSEFTDWLVEQGLTSHSTQFRSFRRRCFYRWDDPTNSVKALKEGG